MNRPYLRVYAPFDYNVITNKKEVMKLEAETDVYTSLQWQNCYNDAGDFEIHMPYTKETYELFSPFKVIYINRPVKEPYGIIIYENVSINERGHKELTIKGKMPKPCATFRGIRTAGISWVANNKPIRLINALVSENTQVPISGNYRLSFLGKPIETLDRTSATYDDLPYSYLLTGETLYDEITTLCKGYDIGFYATVNMNTMQIRFIEYDYNTNNNVLFNIELGNVLNLNVTRSIDNLINGYFFYDGSLANGLQTGSVGSANDICRIERKVDVPFTDTTDFNSVAHTYCRDKLSRNYMAHEVEADITQTNKFYTEDYNIGDIVKMGIKELGISASYPITSVREIWEQGYKIEVGFGQRMLTAYQKMKNGVIK